MHGSPLRQEVFTGSLLSPGRQKVRPFLASQSPEVVESPVLEEAVRIADALRLYSTEASAKAGRLEAWKLDIE